MLERERLESKKISKTNAVTSIMGHELPDDDVHVGPSDYVPWLTDRKWAHIRLEGQAFGDVPLNRRAQARGLGLAELGRHRHRRRALLQARAQPRPLRPARRPELVPHEVAARTSAPTTRRARRPRSSSPSTPARRPAARSAAARRRPPRSRPRRRSPRTRPDPRFGRRAAGRGPAARPARGAAIACPPCRSTPPPAQPARLPRAHVAVLRRARSRAAPQRSAAAEDLPALPLTTKAELRADQAAHPPFGARLCAPREASCGSTSRPGRPASRSRSASRRRPRREQRDRRRGVPDRRRAARRHDRPLPQLRALRGRHRRPYGARGDRGDGRAGRVGQSRRLLELIPRSASPRSSARSASPPTSPRGRARPGSTRARSACAIIVTAGEPGAGLGAVRREIEEAWGATVADTFGMSDVWSTMAGAVRRGRGTAPDDRRPRGARAGRPDERRAGRARGRRDAASSSGPTCAARPRRCCATAPATSRPCGPRRARAGGRRRGSASTGAPTTCCACGP